MKFLWQKAYVDFINQNEQEHVDLGTIFGSLSLLFFSCTFLIYVHRQLLQENGV